MGASRFILASAALALGATSFQAQAAPEPLQLAPSSKWVLNNAEDNCTLSRAFDGDGHQVMLEIRQLAPGEYFQIAVASRTLSHRRKTPKTRFEPDDDWFEPTGPRFTKSDGDMAGILYTSSLWPAKLKNSPELRTDDARDLREKSITGLLVTESFERSLMLQTGEMHKPMEAMRTCVDELLTGWGLDAAVQRTLSRPLEPLNQQKWARMALEGYPAEMAREGQSAEIQLRVIVGPDGKPTSCAVQPETAHPEFKKTACDAVMSFARFKPALDAQGTPVATYLRSTILYTSD